MDAEVHAVSNTRKRRYGYCEGDNDLTCPMKTKRNKLYIVYRVLWIYLDRYISYKKNWCA